MSKNLFKNFVLFSMIFLLNNSVIETIAYATEQNNNLLTNSDSTISAESNDKKSSDDTLNKNSNNTSTSIIDANKKNDNENKISIDYGWKIINNKKYYTVNDKISETTGWFMEKDFNPHIKTKSKNYKDKYYLDKDFSVVVGWKKIDDNWYYFNSEGIMQIGWLYDNSMHYLDDSGIMQTGWKTIDGYTYYFDQYGQTSVGKKLIDNNWYFFDSKGCLEKGFYDYNGKTYYSDQYGIMVTNEWINKGKRKYYIKSDSSIAIGNIFLNGSMYIFDKLGIYESMNSSDESDLYVQYLDVGNADCTFIKLPSGETVLIDTGDTTTTKTLIDFLNDQKLKTDFFVPQIDVQATTSASSTFVTNNTSNSTITNNGNTNNSTISNVNNGKGVIDYVVLTHPHSDHIGGMIELMKNFNIGKVIMPKYFEMKDYSPGATAIDDEKINIIKYDYKIYKATMEALLKSGLPLVEAQPGAYIDSQNILQFLHSNTDYSKLESDTYYSEYGTFNDNSAIVYLNYYDFQGLFAADIQWKAENDFVNRKALKSNQVDILKVPHHGNVGSSSYTFIGYVEPTIGVISRAKEAIKTNTEPYNVLTTCGVNIYETSATNGVSVYATKDNWNIEDKQ